MTRRDGMPTNQEMFVDFNTISRAVFVGAFERALQSDMPAGFQEKPLTSLSLEITENGGNADTHNTQAVSGEKLTIGVISQGMADYLSTEHEASSQYPDHVKERQIKIADHLASIVLSDDLMLGDILPAAGVDASYTAQYPNGRTRYIGLNKERPSKMSIAAGKFFAEKALRYTQADAFEISQTDRFLNALSGVAEDPKYAKMRNAFKIKFSVDLPLNGHESPRFLSKYQEYASDKSQESMERLTKLIHLGAPEWVIENENEILTGATNALTRVNAILDRR